MDFEKLLPPDREQVGTQPFQFQCHPGVPCFLTCCRNVNLLLYPYDILLLKQALHLTSAEVLEKFTSLCEGSHPYFPGLRLKLQDDQLKSCPFLTAQGCSVYAHRPTACRTYPLERGVESLGPGQPLKAHYFLTHHPYCKGHNEPHTYTVKQWERDQQLHQCNLINDMWAELDAFFATNPWAGEGKAGPYQRLAFMTCFDIDRFRSYVNEHHILKGFRLSKDERRRVERDDEALLQFGFQWLEYILGGRKRMVKK
ncbi:YkgJ family cysteine cluster protein [Desulfobulbus propionicus]